MDASLLLLLAPLLGGALLFWAGVLRRLRDGVGWGEPVFRPALLEASLIWGAWLVLSVEALSLAGRLQRLPLFASWTLLCLLCLGALAARGCFSFRKGFACPAGKEALALLRERYRQSLLARRPVAAACLLWFGLVLAIGIAAAPSNYDSMTYHLPRVMRWAQNGSVHFFPTHILRQNHMAPFAEWHLLNLWLLTGSDRLFHLVQWAAYVGSCVAVTLLAGLLGAGRKGEWLAFAFAAFTPMAILQAQTTQNDLAAGYYFLCFLFFGLRLCGSGGRGVCSHALFCGLALGLACLTKTTIFLFAFPFCLWIAWRMLRTRAFGAAVLQGGVIALCLGALLAGHLARSQRFYGSPLGPAGEIGAGGEPDRNGDPILLKYQNARMDPPRFLFSGIRNLAVHCDVAALESACLFVNACVEAAGERLRLANSEPDTTWSALPFCLISNRHEDLAGNFPQVLLFLAASALFPFRRARGGRNWTGYWLCLAGGASLFVLLLRWQPWHSRLHLPLFLAMAPFVGAVMGTFRGRLVAGVLVAAQAAYALPYLLCNDMRPLKGPRGVFRQSRQAQYFRCKKRLAKPYANALAFLRQNGCLHVGLRAGGNDIEYPLWPLSAKSGRGRMFFEDVSVENASRMLSSAFRPDAILAIVPLAEESMQVGGVLFRRAFQEGNVSVFLTGEPGREMKSP